MSIGLHRHQHRTDKRLPSPSGEQAAAHEDEGGEPKLKGTFASVMILGAFIVVTWAAVFILFLVRQ